jgi:hypothetical protein
VPPLFCDGFVDLSVVQEGTSGPTTTTLANALACRQERDNDAPSIECPPDITLVAGPDGYARLGREYQATASDAFGAVSVRRATLGALPVGTDEIDFEAIDERGNRAACGGVVLVEPFAGCAGDATGDGMVDVDDLVEVLLVVDLRTMDAPHWLRFGGIVKELYDVGVLPGVIRPMAVGFKTDEVRRYLSFPEVAEK